MKYVCLACGHQYTEAEVAYDGITPVCADFFCNATCRKVEEPCEKENRPE